MGYCGMNRSKSVVSSGSVLFFVLFIWNFIQMGQKEIGYVEDDDRNENGKASDKQFLGYQLYK